MRLGEATEGYLSSGALSIDTEAADWVERLILVLPKNELHALILGYAGEKPLRIDRNPDEESKVEWVLTEGGGKDQILEPLTLNKITTRLADLEFEELADGDVEEPEKDQLRTLDAIAKDGRRYRIELNMAKREGNLHAMTIRASTDETANARAQEEAEAFNASFAGQTYFVRPHQLNGAHGRARNLVQAQAEVLHCDQEGGERLQLAAEERSDRRDETLAAARRRDGIPTGWAGAEGRCA